MSALTSIMEEVRAGELTPDEAAIAAREAMIRRFDAAWRFGFQVAGLENWQPTNRQQNSFIAYLEEEVGFFRRFMRDLATEAMDPVQRVGMYAGGAQGIFWHGWTAGMPSTAQIWWHRTAVESCPDCIELEANNPYSKPGTPPNPLPTTPRSGDTRCLSNCRCYIESVGIFESGLINHPEVEVTSIGETAVDPMSGPARTAAGQYREMAERWAWHRRMAAAGVQVDLHDRIARDIERQINDLARRLGHSVRLTTAVWEVTEDVSLARAAGWRFVPPDQVADDLVLAVATAIALRRVDRGTVTSATAVPPQITLDGDPERTYRLDDVGKGLLFIEEEPPEG